MDSRVSDPWVSLHEPDTNLVSRFRRAGTVSAGIALLLAVIVLIGWAARIPVLISGLPNLVPAHILAALCASLLDLAVLLQYLNRGARVSSVIAIVVGLFSILVLIGLAGFLFPPFGSTDAQVESVLSPDQMAPNSVICILLAAVSLWSISRKPSERRYRSGQLFALMASTVSLLALIGYSYSVEPLYGIGAFRAMSLPGAVDYLLLGITLFLLHPDRGVTRILTIRSPAGVLSRRLYAAALVVPPVLGFISLLGATRWNQYDLPFALALVVVSSIMLFSVVIALTSRNIEGSDRLRLRAEQDLERSRERLRELSQSIQIMQEEERLRIAREVHDELGQLLTAIKMDMSLLRSRVMENPGAEAKLAGTIDLVNSTIKTVQRITSELRPSILDNLGLSAAIEWQTREFEVRSGIECHCHIPDEYLPVGQEIATAVFRIFQETLTNIARHSQATVVYILLEERAHQLVLEVRDNGRGLSEGALERPQSFGIMGMRERAKLVDGDLTITSSEHGTTVLVTIPIPESLEESPETLAGPQNE